MGASKSVFGLHSDWFLARPIFIKLERAQPKCPTGRMKASPAPVSNNKVSNYKVSTNKVHVLRMLALFIWFLIVTECSLIFLNLQSQKWLIYHSDNNSSTGVALSNFFLQILFITRMITDQIGFHSVLLPLLVGKSEIRISKSNAP